jgi:hypothetical protein
VSVADEESERASETECWVDGDGSCGIILEIPPETRDPQRERERERAK